MFLSPTQGRVLAVRPKAGPMYKGPLTGKTTENSALLNQQPAGSRQCTSVMPVNPETEQKP